MRNVMFANDYFYHVFNRGIEKMVIFRDKADFLRFYRGLFVFNDVGFRSPSTSIFSLRNREIFDSLVRKRRKTLVDIVSFCLLPNHFHLLIRQNCDNGISTFLHRLCSGYVHYFNKRYERSGSLFEGEFKAVLVEKDAHFIHLPRYIHLNALDVHESLWREGLIQDWDEAQKFLDTYPWSSHHVYDWNTQELPVVNNIVVRELFSTPREYRKFLRSWSVRSMPPLSCGMKAPPLSGGRSGVDMERGI